MITFPNAKINIGLNILRKREDGFHDIESIMYPLKGICFDALEIVSPSPALPKGKGERKAELFVSGISIQGNSEDNLCLKAYNLIAKDYPLPPINIYLHKAIPMGAGLGGGSADGAFMIRLLNDEFELGLAWGELHHYAKQLGSDCSFFISNMPAFAEGRGDELETLKLDLSNYHIAVVYPNIHINTAEAYAMVKPRHAPALKGEKFIPCLREVIQQHPLGRSERTPSEGATWKNNIHNDFEDAIFPKHPELKKIKEKLYSLGAVYASMSGSGSAVYGIFRKDTSTPLSVTSVKKYFRGMSVWQGMLG